MERVKYIRIEKKKTGILNSHMGEQFDVYSLLGKTNKLRKKVCGTLKFSTDLKHARLNTGNYILANKNNLLHYLERETQEHYFLGFAYRKELNHKKWKLMCQSHNIQKIDYQEDKFQVSDGNYFASSKVDNISSKSKKKIQSGSYYSEKDIQNCFRYHIKFMYGDVVKKQLKKFALYKNDFQMNMKKKLIQITFCGGVLAMLGLCAKEEVTLPEPISIQLEKKVFEQKSVVMEKSPIQKVDEKDTSIMVGDVVSLPEGISYADRVINPTYIGNTESLLVQEQNQIYMSAFSIVAYNELYPNGFIVRTYKEIGTSYDFVKQQAKKIELQYPNTQYAIKVHYGYIDKECFSSFINPYQLGWADAKETNEKAKVLSRNNS